MKAIAYTRTSTKDQKISHSAQLAAITSFCNRQGMDLVNHFSDYASGTDNERDGLLKAITLAKKTKAPIVVLRMDRLGRKLSYLFTLMEDSNINFIFAENGINADKLTLSILAVVAAEERRKISIRTKEALQQLKAQGVQLGNRTNLKEAQAKGTATMKLKGEATLTKYTPVVKAIMDSGITSIRKVAKRLEEMGVRTPRGSTKWSNHTTQRIMQSL